MKWPWDFICLTVWMKHFARESHFRWTERIVLRKNQFHRKGAPIEGSPIWASEVSRLLRAARFLDSHIIIASHSKKFSSFLGPEKFQNRSLLSRRSVYLPAMIPSGGFRVNSKTVQ